jgi:hypothetical protein
MMRVVDGNLHCAFLLLSQPLRKADVTEWEASGKSVGLMLLDALRRPLSITRALLNERGLCICMWGVVKEGGVWLLASEEAERKARCIQRLWASELALMHDFAGDLHAVADSRNKLHLYWLRRVGFEFICNYEVNPRVPPFHLYRRRAECAARLQPVS